MISETHSNYPRPVQTPIGAPIEALQALVDGYFGLTRVFLLEIGMFIAVAVVVVVVGSLAGNHDSDLVAVFNFALVIGVYVATAILAYKQCKRVEFGLGGPKFLAILFTGLIIVMGLIGYIIVQSIASSGMRKFNMKRGLFFTKKKAQAYIDYLKSVEPASPPPSYQP